MTTTTKSNIIRRTSISLAVTSGLLMAGSIQAAKTGLPQIEIQSKASEFNQPIRDIVETKVHRGADQFDVTTPTEFNGDIRHIPAKPSWQPGDPVKIANPRHTRPIKDNGKAVNRVKEHKSLLEKRLAKTSRAATDLEIGVNIPAFSFNGVNPPDPTGEVGEEYYITAINAPNGSAVSIFKKTDGSKVGETFSMSELSGGGDCKTQPMGDPIVVYDEYAKRWVLTEFSAEGPNKMCVYVSKSSDPVSGGWWAYEFQAPEFPDYPKYGVFGDVYYVSANEGGGAVYAFERAKMLNGETAAMVRKAVPALAGFGFQSITPVDADGINAPAAGTPGLFIRHRDDELHNSGSNDGEKDFLEIWTFEPNFSAPDSSVLTGPHNIAINELDSNFTCPDGFGCLTQKDDGSGSLSTLDPLKEVVYYKAQYRNFNSHESITASFATKLAQNNAGLRWFELRKQDGTWALHQEGMVPANDNNSRYMAGAAMDGDGNMAVAYMVTGPEQFPSIRATGRRMGDALGTIADNEITIHEADGAIPTERDGDYSHMSVDPVDNCTIWFTAEHGGANTQWGTKVASMKFPGCTGVGSTDPGFSLSASNRSQHVCKSGNLSPIEIKVTGYNDFNGQVSLAYENLATGFSGSFSDNPVAAGATSNAQLNVADGTAAGDYNYSVKGSSDGVDPRSFDGTIKVVESASNATLAAPADGADKVDLQPTLSWNGQGFIASVTVEIARDAEFTDIVATGQVSGGDSYRPSSALPQSTKLYWRVKASNVCGDNTSDVRSFTTKSEKDDATEIKNGTPQTISAEADSVKAYWIDVPASAEKLVITSDGPAEGDVDLYVGFNQIPKAAADVVCAGEEYGNNERCEISVSEAGTYFILAYAYEAFSDVTLKAEFASTKPIISDQQTLAIDEDSQLELTPEQLTIVDSDSTSFTLNIASGDNYTVSGSTITPAANFNGELTIAVTVSDGDNTSDSYPVKVTVRPVNDAPQLQNDSITVEQDSSATTIDVLANDSDIEGDALTLSDTSYSGSGSVNIVDGKISYTPASGFHGSETIGYTVTDAQGASAEAEVAVTVTKKADGGSDDDSSGGGSSDWFALLLLPMLGAFRRRVKK